MPSLGRDACGHPDTLSQIVLSKWQFLALMPCCRGWRALCDNVR